MSPPVFPPRSRGTLCLTPLAFGLLLLCAGCSGSGSQARWDGRRGYDGNGDYGYDLAASRAEARSYRARAARSYPVPGTPDDPWGPYVREAASRYQVPERWIREVMRQESGGRQFDGRGGLVTSSAGAMGLMQVMPATYDMLRRRYRLGDDPFEPHDNIMAGTAYIREMYDRFGSPGFLAAYNAGPDRLDAYLAGDTSLPDETIGYLSSIAPRLGNPESMTGPLAVYAGGTAVASASSGTASANRAYLGGGAVGSDAAYLGGGAVASADRAYMGGG
ncbi:MAG: lytic transglycosylase domain-containing protein, partial [Rhodospirillales bacterium]|nr:lytic transglycosylase domain-containing protein [Rhodospirillales bacterium]